MSQLQVTGEAKVRDIQGPVVANSGVITALDGDASQYVRGDGTLADFPTSTGGGSSVSYYLNSSVSQGTIGGNAYRQLSKTPISGAGTDITASTNGYIANYITDANDPSLLEVPAGNFNCEFYFSVNSNNNNPYVYAELYKYDGTTFTLLGSNQAIPEYLTNGTTLSAYYFAIPVAVAALTITDRLAIRIYVNVDGRVVTLHTENGHLCQVVTTFSKGLTTLNNLTRQVQYLATGTSGTDFGISSSVATHTFNLPIASASNTGKLSSTDWSTFNSKQNALTNPITGTGASTQIAYFNSGTSITSEAAFNYDASTNRLGVNTSVPNATIGANAGTDSGYSLLLKNDNANYNGIGFGTDSTYGNLIATEKLGTAPARNLTLLNQSGYISLTEVGNLGVNILSPNTGVDIYNGSNAYLWLHTATSGITGTDGVRLALFSTNGANLRNFEGAMSITSEGDFQVITLGAENIRVNSADGKVGIGNPASVPEMLTVNGSIQQSGVLSSLLKTNGSGKLIAAVAGTDYVIPSALSGYVPTSRELTINGTTYDLSANRSWTITSDITGSGADGRVAYWNGTNSLTSEAGFIYDASTNRLGVNTSVPNATIGADSALDSGYGLLIKTGASNYNGIGIAIDSTYGNLISTEKLGSATARNLTLLNQSGFVSLKENGNFGVNTLNPSVSGTGIDIYGSTSTSLRLHTATSGTTVSDGAGINFSAANNLGITNYEAGTIDIVTNGNSGVFVATNGFVGINGATPSVALTVTGAGLFSTSLSVAGLTTGQILFPTSGGTLAGSSNLFWDNTNGRLSIGASTNANRRLTVYSSSDAEHLALISNVPAITFGSDNSYTYYSGIGMATAANNFVTGTVAGDLTLGAFYANKIILFNSNTNTQRMNLNGDGAVIFSGSVTGRGGKSQIVVDGNSVGCGISLTNTIVGANRRNWGIFTEDNVDGDFVIKRSTTSGGSANTNVLSFSRDGAASFTGALSGTSATFSSSVTIAGTNDGYGTLYVSALASTNAARLRNDNASFATLDINNANASGTGVYSVASKNYFSGNVGIGVTPSAWSVIQAMQILNTSYGASPNNLISYMSSNVFFDGAFKYITTGTATQYRMNDSGAFSWLQAPSGTAGNAISFTTAMTITSGGNVGINTQSPRGYFNVKNGSGELVLSQGNGRDIQAIFNGSQGNMDLSCNNLYISYLGTGTVYSNGGVLTNTNPSDANLKENITDLTFGLNEILQLRPVSYDWKNNVANQSTQYGFIAQEVQKVLPQLVTEFDSYEDEKREVSIKRLGLDKDAIFVSLVKAIQELEARIKQLENK